jgi:hypothetical protein
MMNGMTERMNWPGMGESGTGMGMGRDFMQTNTIIGKVAFLLMVVLVFIILLRLGLMLLSWAISPKGSVVILPGMIDATEFNHISVDPTVKGSIPINRSVDEDKGLEFTWSTWIFVKDPTESTVAKHIFNKGSDMSNGTDSGIAEPNNAPGMYLTYDTTSTISDVGSNGGTGGLNNSMTLTIRMNSFVDKNEEIKIPYLPSRKWVSIIMTCYGRIVNVYINGTLAQRRELRGVPKQNYGDIYVANNGGFGGNISDLRYYDYELSNFMINYLVLMGPNKKVIGKMIGDKNSSYLSSKWFFSGNEDAYYPSN